MFPSSTKSLIAFTVAILAIALVFNPLVSATDNDDNGSDSKSGSGDAKVRRDNADKMVSFGLGHCKMVEGLKNCSQELEPEDQALFDEMIDVVDTICNGTRDKGSDESSADDSSDEDQDPDRKYQEISKELKKMFLDYAHIAKKIGFCHINDDEGNDHGCLRDVIEVGIQIDSESVEETITLGPSGECPICEAMRNATSDSSQCDGSCSSRIESLIVEIHLILENSAYSIEQMMVAISIEVSIFCEGNADLVDFLMSIHIEGFGSFGDACDVFDKYESVSEASEQVSGSSSSDCPLLEALESVTTNESYSLEVRSQVNQLKVSIEVYFSVTVDLELRLGYVSSEFYSCLELEPWLEEIVLSLELSTGYGDIYDLLAASHFCTNNGACSLVNEGLDTTAATDAASAAASSAAPAASSAAPPTTKPTSAAPTTKPTSAAPTTKPTTVAPTTKPTTVAPTTARKCNCTLAARKQVLQLQPNGRYIVIDSIKAVYLKWNTTIQTSYSSTFSQTKYIVWNTTISAAVKITKLVPLWASWMKNNKPVRELELQIPLGNGSQYWGTIRDYILCSNATMLN